MTTTLAAVYITPFRSRLPEKYQTANRRALSESTQALRAGTWPYDFGDDPAFYSARAQRGPVTWGVCRRDVRRAVQPGHVLLFFSVEEEKHNNFIYKFCALLTVKQKIRQTDIWKTEALNSNRQFRRYENLLIRPTKDSWRQSEPGLPQREWHKDWLSRLTFKDSDTIEFRQAQENGFLTNQQAERFVDRNYIIFSNAPEASFICEYPQAIASCGGNGMVESWVDSPFANKLKSFTVDHTRGNLRTRNKQRAHRHSKWLLEQSELQDWRGGFVEWLRKRVSEITASSPFDGKMRNRSGHKVC